MGFLLLLPAILIGAAALAAIMSVRRSSLRITAAGVQIHNYRSVPQVIPMAQVDRFVEPERVGHFAGLRPATAVLLLTDGTRVTVRAIAEPDAGYGIEALNRRVAALRNAR